MSEPVESLDKFCCDLILPPHKTHTTAFDSDIRVLFHSGASVTQNLMQKTRDFLNPRRVYWNKNRNLSKNYVLLYRNLPAHLQLSST